MPKRQIPRAPDRPNDGDAKTCPFCRALMYFHEPQPRDAQPGWFCSCGYRIFVRQSAAKPSLDERQRALTERVPKVLRRPMAVRSTDEAPLNKSEHIRTSRPGRKK